MIPIPGMAMTGSTNARLLGREALAHKNDRESRHSLSLLIDGGLFR